MIYPYIYIISISVYIYINTHLYTVVNFYFHPSFNSDQFHGDLVDPCFVGIRCRDLEDRRPGQSEVSNGIFGWFSSGFLRATTFRNLFLYIYKYIHKYTQYAIVLHYSIYIVVSRCHGCIVQPLKIEFFWHNSGDR